MKNPIIDKELAILLARDWENKKYAQCCLWDLKLLELKNDYKGLAEILEGMITTGDCTKLLLYDTVLKALPKKVAKTLKDCGYQSSEIYFNSTKYFKDGIVILKITIREGILFRDANKNLVILKFDNLSRKFSLWHCSENCSKPIKNILPKYTGDKFIRGLVNKCLEFKSNTTR